MLSLKDLEWKGRDSMPAHVSKATSAGAQPKPPALLHDKDLRAWFDRLEAPFPEDMPPISIPPAKRAKLAGEHTHEKALTHPVLQPFS